MSNLNSNGGLVAGRTVVVTAGTPVQLAVGSRFCTEIYVSALAANTAPVVVGGPTVVGAAATRTGAVVPNSGQTPLLLVVDDPSKVWLDAQVSGEGVSFTFREP